MSKFKAEDDVRVIKDGPYFDEAGIVRESMYRAGRIIYRVKFRNLIPAWFSEADLTLADPDVHTVLDQMDKEGAADPVNHPAHYGGDTTYEVIKVAEAWGLDKDAYLFNVLKYVARAGKKGDVLEDLEKGDFYLNRRIATIKAAQ